MKYIIIISFVVMSLWMVSPTPGQTPHLVGHFPFDKQLFDPSGRWSIVWQEATENSAHTLLLKDLKTGVTTTLLEFDRHVTVTWAPDGKALAITDYTGSTDAQIVVAQPGVSPHLIDVEKTFIRDMGRLPKIYENSHRYFEALNWIGPRTLRFKVTAWDTTPDGYESIFRYVVGGKVSRDRKRK